VPAGNAHSRLNPPRTSTFPQVGELSGIVDTDSGVHIILRTA
jgi:hypothetical protein